jgi:molybdenum cofactor cytidylyltransferase
VVNRAWRAGLASSLRAAMAALPRDARGALVMLADQVTIGPADLELLIAAWRREPRAIVTAVTEGIRGPPAVFPRRDFAELQRLQGDRGARSLLRNPAKRVIELELPAARVDVDWPEDVATARAKAPGRSRRSVRSSRARRPRLSGAT